MEAGTRSVRRRNTARIAGAALAAVLVAWTAGLVRFAGAIPRDVADPETPTEAIVVLTGGRERLATGLRLLMQDKAERMFVSGVHPGVDVDRLLLAAGQPSPALAGRIEAGHAALDTAGNAAETARWMRQRGYRSLRLVTSSYHMPRSLAEFRRVLPDVRVIPHPVFSPQVAQARWWQRPATMALIIGEYHKYLLSHIDFRYPARAVALSKDGP